MTDREAFEAWAESPRGSYIDAWGAYQAALASERAQQAEPVLFQCAEHGADKWYECSRASYGLNTQRYKFRALYAAPPADEAVRLLADLGRQIEAFANEHGEANFDISKASDYLAKAKC